MKNQGFINRLEAGNAFVIILIMIALLAALTITLTRMGSTTSDLNQEQAQVVASQVLRQGKTMANAADLLLARGCSISQLSFENTTITGYLNAHSPTDKSCQFFAQEGAGLSFPLPPKSSNNGSNWVIVRSMNVAGVGREREDLAACVSNCAEIILFLPLVDLNVCKAINASVGIGSYSSAPPRQMGSAPLLNFKFQTSNPAPNPENFSDPTNTDTGRFMYASTPLPSNPLWDKKTACIETSAAGFTDESGTVVSGTGNYLFYQVLVER